MALATIVFLSEWQKDPKVKEVSCTFCKVKYHKLKNYREDLELRMLLYMHRLTHLSILTVFLYI